ncbi:hypothetical protein Tco_1045248 [Tanacetum coccineum]|uniref:Uncharacterized protein n=1 Tax=Tanacetum coccineum TaxID=301880 RepID=A0ABQ5GS66_9ASTR
MASWAQGKDYCWELNVATRPIQMLSPFQLVVIVVSKVIQGTDAQRKSSKRKLEKFMVELMQLKMLSRKSFVDTRFSSMLNIDPVKIRASYEVELADGRVFGRLHRFVIVICEALLEALSARQRSILTELHFSFTKVRLLCLASYGYSLAFSRGGVCGLLDNSRNNIMHVKFIENVFTLIDEGSAHDKGRG